MCSHEQFEADVRVGRLTKDDDESVITGYAADIRIKCSQCGQQFAFVGVPAGYSPFEPKVSVDSTELRIPITPSTGQVVFEAKTSHN